METDTARNHGGDAPSADPEREAQLLEEIQALRPEGVPQWVRDLRPENPGGLASVVGKWPGDETDEEVAAALQELS
jgi:hypothetical protein